MPQATLRFYAELNDFLRPLDCDRVNGESVDFAYPVRDGDRFSVYPVFEPFDIAVMTRVRVRAPA